MQLGHNQLQSKCFLWAWNNYPETRQLLWHTPNEIRPFPGETQAKLSLRIAQAKSIGMVPGVLDLVFYWKGCLHVFDIKLGLDRLSGQQRHFIGQVEDNGGKSYIISDFEQFCRIFTEIVSQNIQNS